MKFDRDRPPVTIEDRADATPLEWLGWIVDNHPHVSAPGQAILIDGALVIRVAAGPPAPERSLLWVLQVLVDACRRLEASRVRPPYLAEVLPDGRRRWFKAPVPPVQRLDQNRCIWHGPTLTQLVDELRAREVAA